MVKSLLFFLIIIFAIWGSCDLIYLFRLIAFSPKERFGTYNVVNLKSGTAMQQLRFLWAKLSWHGDDFASCIIALTDELSAIEIEKCRAFTSNKKIILCNSDFITDYIKEDI